MRDRIEKVCPVLLRRRGGQQQWLVFQHPKAGVQMIKGGRNPGEAICAGALRELFEETGLSGGSARHFLSSDQVVPGELWHFVLCRTVGRVPDRWRWFTSDGGGLWFAPFWLRIDVPMPGRYGRAADLIRETLKI